MLEAFMPSEGRGGFLDLGISIQSEGVRVNKFYSV